ncbi:Dyp-type peroxidase [Brumimicrobium mesophilum]|uniref:Dyp-type peroxidase n=1 Tax=Brumimicrobium mesophilum TaxID=392717 RepID=UPI000D140110|nr:Dyp-type peroxidase [Brumimicrobium mesophilum]
MAIVDNPRTLDLDDIQGMVSKGYGKLYKTAYFFLKVDEAKKAKLWLKEIAPFIDSANIKNTSEKTLHLAFTPSGLSKLGLSQKNIDAFPTSFVEGVSTENRNRILGDYGDSDPQNWRWGAQQSDLDILLIFHASSVESLNAFIEEQKGIIEDNGGITIVTELKGFLTEDNKEPFGFHDGISQPIIKGSGRPGPENDIVETGEFLLGYKNEHGQYPFSPLLEENQGNLTLLADDIAGSGKKDLGRNGTFMVFRQMEQHVDKFWNSMEEKTKNEDGSVNEDAKIKLASKCIGRWPSGASLVNFPDADPGGSLDNDDFSYADHDPDGLKCPFGSHLRTNNPRDSFRWYNKEQSLKVSKRHRIIRRGRSYEMPVNGNEDKKEVGLQFICFNTNIELQFEFIQHAWSNNNQMRHLSNDIDVIIGVPPENDPNNKNVQFTVQAEPVNEYYDGWERFVTIKGGEYFFFPSISVINFLSTL